MFCVPCADYVNVKPHSHQAVIDNIIVVVQRNIVSFCIELTKQNPHDGPFWYTVLQFIQFTHTQNTVIF